MNGEDLSGGDASESVNEAKEQLQREDTTMVDEGRAWLLEDLLDSDLARRLADPDGLDLGELRALRRQAQAVETAVSYARRMVQGRIDLLMAIVKRNVQNSSDEGREAAEGLCSHPGSGSQESDLLTDVIEDLPSILAGARPQQSGRTELPEFLVPALDSPDLMAWMDEMDSIFGPGDLEAVSKADPGDLRLRIERMSALEARLSSMRHEVHRIIDHIQEAVVRSYRTGGANASHLLQ